MILSMLFIAGLSMLVQTLVLMHKSISAKNWPTTMGNIQRLSLQTEEIQSTQFSTTNHEVKVTYNYFIHGEMYIGSQIAFGYCGGKKIRSQQPLMEKLRSSSTVLVRYNPNNYKISTLSFGINRSIKESIAFAFCYLCIISYPILAEMKIFLYNDFLFIGSVVFACGFIIYTVVDYPDNTIIQNISTYN